MSEEFISEDEGNIQYSPESKEEEPLLRSNPSVSVKSRQSSWNWKNLLASVCLWLAYVMCNVAYSIIAPFFPEEAEQRKGSTPIITSIIISSSALSVVILSPIFGYFLTHLGTRFMISSGLLLIGGVFFLFGFVDMLPPGRIFITLCILLKLVEGVGTAMFSTATFTLLPVLFPKSVGTITGLFEVAEGLGFALGPPLGGVLYQLGGFRLPFFSLGGSVLLFILPCTLLVKGNVLSPKKQTIPLKMILQIFTSFPFIVLAMAMILALVGLSFFAPTVQPFLSRQFGLNPLKVGLVLFIAPATYIISALVTGPLTGPLSDRLGPRPFIVFGLALYGLGFFFVGHTDFIGAPKLWMTCVAFGVVGLAGGVGIVPIYADMLEIVKKQLKIGDENKQLIALTAVVSGMVSSFVSFGEFLGPLVGGALTEVLPFTTSSLLLGEIILAEVLLLLGVTLIHRRT